ncbi:serine hydrolase domain-containing protein [Paenibacillus sp. GCM10027626]|uniref:serine hydrolase domain-containing protein n=1 Tax=Paenibacillus sp. GCM10027626 TaxID=3273411 RepID=UPI0036268292
MGHRTAETAIEQYFRHTVQQDSGICNAYLLVHSDKLGLHLNAAEGFTGLAKCTADARQPYFVASVSKLLTAVVAAMLAEEGRLNYEERIVNYLDDELTERLHVYKGQDYTAQIQLKHLLNHTSGLHCFIEDRPKQGKRMIELVLQDPHKKWTPREAILWSKQHLQALSPPGRRFHYSDTGYHLLGFIIERVTQLPLHEVLRRYLFEPLGMKHSCLLGAEPLVLWEHPVADLLVNRTNIAHFDSLHFMYAGGGIISTNADLLLFMQALVQHRLISEPALNRMRQHKERFFLGIDYGYGVMEFKHVPLFMPRKYEVWGNAGSTGSFLFYHPATESYLIGSLNHFRYNRKGIRLMLNIINKLS